MIGSLIRGIAGPVIESVAGIFSKREDRKLADVTAKGKLAQAKADGHQAIELSRAEWEAVFEGSDVCFGPVLEPWEAPDHPHARARHAFEEVAGVVQPAPAPRFSRTKSEIQGPPAYPGQHTTDILNEIGVNGTKAEALKSSGAVR